VRVDALPVDEPVAAVLRDLGRAVYVLTQGRSLIRETPDRAGSLRAVVSRHVAHACPAEPTPATPARQLGLFDLESVQPARGNGGMW
jgi:hypothetical protein